MILDHAEDIKLSEEQVAQHYDSIQALARLGEGLFWIAQEVGKLEQRARLEAAQDDTQIAIVGGLLDDKPMGLLACAFQWYAISACNYAQLVGWLHTHDSKKAKDYVRRVMPIVESNNCTRCFDKEVLAR